MKKYIALITIWLLFASCAKTKVFKIDGKVIIAEPYGWADSKSAKRDAVIYTVNKPNIILSIILCETVVVPVWLTGWELYEAQYFVTPDGKMIKPVIEK